MSEVPPSFAGDLTKRFSAFRSAWQFKAFILYILAGGGLIIAGGLNLPNQKKFRSILVEANLYLEKTSSVPEAALTYVTDRVQVFFMDQNRLLTLKERAFSQQEWEIEARRLKQENQRLRSLLTLVPNREKNYVTAEVYHRARKTSENSLFLSPIDSKREDQDTVQALSPVVKGSHLVGHIKEKGTHSAVIQPITATQSRVPVISEKSGIKAILAGTGYGTLTVLHIDNSASFEEGELLFSTSEGSLYPSNYVVGQVVLGKGKKPEIIPFLKIQNQSYVFILPPLMRETP